MHINPTSKTAWYAAIFGALVVAGALHAQTTEVPNRREPLAGVTTAGQPGAEALAALSKAGYQAVIDLRGPSEQRGFDERTAVEALGMRYVNLPVEGAAGVTYDNAAALDRLLAELPAPVLVHCSTGNRAGALLALRAKQNGAADSAALALGVEAGLTGLKPTVEERLRETSQSP
jgi:uncharacterized protein (TIGR01244 family)